MDLIYTNSEWVDEGVLRDYAFDLAYGSDENDFEITLADEGDYLSAGALLYIEGTEYGGIIDGVKVVSKYNEVTFKGRTWHGVMASKVLKPDDGKDYLTVTGEANKVIGQLLQNAGLSSLFTASIEDSGLTLNNYQVGRYVDCYTGIMKMLATVSGKLKFTFRQGKVMLSACPVVDYSQDEQFDGNQVELEIEKIETTVNHLICLGKGELAQRQVVHLFLDGAGNISTTQTFEGFDEVESVFDYPNAESQEELIASGKEKLAEYAVKDIVKMNFEAEKHLYDIGDIVGAYDGRTDIFAAEKITKKIVTIKNGHINIEYKVGE